MDCDCSNYIFACYFWRSTVESHRFRMGYSFRDSKTDPYTVYTRQGLQLANTHRTYQCIALILDCFLQRPTPKDAAASPSQTQSFQMRVAPSPFLPE